MEYSPVFGLLVVDLVCVTSSIDEIIVSEPMVVISFER